MGISFCLKVKATTSKKTQHVWTRQRGKVKGKAKSRSSRAGLQFPVGRIHRLLRKGNYAERVGAGHPSTWPQSWNISRPRCWSWRVTQPGTTRRPGSSLATYNWPSGMTRSSTNCSQASQSLREEFYQISRLSSYPRKVLEAERKSRQARSFNNLPRHCFNSVNKIYFENTSMINI